MPNRRPETGWLARRHAFTYSWALRDLGRPDICGGATRILRTVALWCVCSIWGCGDTATAPKIPNVAGSWTGTESDRLGPALLTWSLTQTGYTVLGTVTMRPVNPADGSCASCHKSKDGTFSGTMERSTLTFAMYFPAGAAGDPTPACSITINGAAPNVTATTIAGTYSGSDPCEDFFDGTLTMSRTP